MNRKILIVDDELMIRKGIRLMIDEMNLPVEIVGEAEDGSTAIQFLQDHPVDIVITDICMQEMNGIQLSAWISQKRPQIDVIILTCYGEFEYAQQAIEYRVRSYLLKPVQSAKLFEVLNDLLGDARGERQEKRILQKLIQTALRDIKAEKNVPLEFPSHWEKACSSGHFMQKEYLLEKIWTAVEDEIYRQLNFCLCIARPKPDVQPDIQWISDTLLSVRDFYRGEIREANMSIYAEIKCILAENLSMEIPIEEIADRMGYNASYLGQLFKSKSGKTLSRYRNEMRMFNAKRMLLETSMSITSIAYAVGYTDVSYFDRLFYQLYGSTPRNYRSKYSV